MGVCCKKKEGSNYVELLLLKSHGDPASLGDGCDVRYGVVGQVDADDLDDEGRGEVPVVGGSVHDRIQGRGIVTVGKASYCYYYYIMDTMVMQVIPRSDNLMWYNKGVIKLKQAQDWVQTIISLAFNPGLMTGHESCHK